MNLNLSPSSLRKNGTLQRTGILSSTIYRPDCNSLIKCWWIVLSLVGNVADGLGLVLVLSWCHLVVSVPWVKWYKYKSRTVCCTSRLCKSRVSRYIPYKLMMNGSGVWHCLANCSNCVFNCFAVFGGVTKFCWGSPFHVHLFQHLYKYKNKRQNKITKNTTTKKRMNKEFTN